MARLAVALLAGVFVIFFALQVSADPAPDPRPAKCDYSVGKWVKSADKPQRYSGVGWESNYCKYIRSGFNCETNNRPDQLYRQLRWQPEKCDLDYVTPEDWGFLMKGKRMLMVGDSITNNAYQSLLCLISSADNRGKPFDDDSAPKGLKGVDFPSIDFSLHFYFSPYLTQAERRKPIVNQTGTPGYKVNITTIDPVVQFLVPYYDVVLFSTGVWWSQNFPGSPKQPDQYYIQGGLVNITNVNAQWYAVKSWANFLTRIEYPGMPYFLSFSPKHGPVNPTDPGEGSCGATRPMQWEEAMDEYSNLTVAEDYYKSQKNALRGSVFRHVRVTRMSETRPDAHLGMWNQIQPDVSAAFRTPDKGDCTHWCLPGLPDSWMDMLYTQMLLEPLLLTPN
ncbi:hypothetical protein CLOM_g4967 [Closterium sp. NIES-68]|nr:hypothetical protein CLOM_g4967 [Closterium sp. NIES-68]GJP61990.1 hypothetical protein CLOP_g19101 [Closterium sp. NIES-67]